MTYAEGCGRIREYWGRAHEKLPTSKDPELGYALLIGFRALTEAVLLVGQVLVAK